MRERLDNASKKGNLKNMATAVLGIPKEVCPPFEIGPAGALFGGSSVVNAKLISSDKMLILELASMLDTQLLAVLESRTKSEFAETRRKIWPKYIRSARALSDTVNNLMSESQIAIIAEVAINTLKEDLEKQHGIRFDEKLIDQTMFTLWVMIKIRSMGRKIHDAGEPSDMDADLKLNRDYQLHLLWTQFHIDCVVAAMKFRKSVPGDVQEVICEGLRTAVNVYAIMKDALRLRRPELQASLEAALPWDEEDEELLASSMRDMNALSDSIDN